MQNIRPPFLTYLCITTFIVSAFFIWTSAGSVLSDTNIDKNQLEEVFDQVKDQIEASAKNEVEAQKATEIFDKMLPDFDVVKFKNYHIGNLISALLSLIGAVLMWGLNKKGMWLYFLGTAITIIAPFFIFDSILAYAFSLFFGFFGLIFSLLYYTNFKNIN